jgi:uncharacterized RDD family membrane protein YckC
MAASHRALATICDRVIAKMIDGICLAVPALIVHFVFLRGASRIVHLAVGFPVEFLYTVVPVALFGQTLGKAARKIRVVGPDGQRPGWSRSVRRYIVGALPLYVPLRLLEPVLSAVVYVRVFTAPDRRGLHDLFADTSVTSDHAPGRSVTIEQLRRQR